MAIVATAHPLGLYLEAFSNGYESGDFALIGLKVVRAHGFVFLLVLGKATADLVKAFLSGVKPPLEVLDLLIVLLVSFIEGLEEAVNEAPQVFGSHFKDSQCSGHGPWGEGEREGGGILGFLSWWWYGKGGGRGDRGLVGKVD